MDEKYITVTLKENGVSFVFQKGTRIEQDDGFFYIKDENGVLGLFDKRNVDHIVTTNLGEMNNVENYCE